jgi:hypothetical protein
MIEFVKKHFVWFAIAFFFFLAISITLYDSRITTDPEEWNIRGDLTKYSLAASKVMLNGGDAYDSSANPYNNKYKYFPLNATLLVPLAFLPIPMAQGLWVAINACLVIFALWSLKELAGRKRLNFFIWIGAFIIAGRFIIDCIQLGQWNLPTFSLTVIGLWLIIARKRPWIGGLVVALAAGMKYMPAVFILYFLSRRQWKPAIAILLGMALWILILPTLVWGPSRHIDMLGHFVETSHGQKKSMIDEHNYTGHSMLVYVKSSLTKSIHHAGHDIEGEMNIVDLPPHVAGNIAFAACFVLALCTFLITARGKHTEPGLRTLLDISMVFALLLLISPEVRKAQLLTMYVPSFTLILAWRWFARGTFERRLALGGLLFAFVVMFVSSDHGDGWEPTQEWLVLHGTWTLYIMTFWLSCLLLRFRALRDENLVNSSQ